MYPRSFLWGSRNQATYSLKERILWNRRGSNMGIPIHILFLHFQPFFIYFLINKMLWPLTSLLKNAENALYKSCLTANRKFCATENMWGNKLPQLGISVWASYVVVSSINNICFLEVEIIKILFLFQNWSWKSSEDIHSHSEYLTSHLLFTKLCLDTDTTKISFAKNLLFSMKYLCVQDYRNLYFLASLYMIKEGSSMQKYHFCFSSENLYQSCQLKYFR